MSERVPEGWKISNLGEKTKLIKDGTHGTHARFKTGVPLLSAKNITKFGKLEWDENDSFISDKDYQAIHSKYTIEERDILLTVVGTLGRVAIVNDKHGKFAVQRSVAIIRMDEKQFDPQFCIQSIRSDQFQKQLEIRSNSTAQAGVYLGELAKIKLIIPPLPEQKKIASILTSVDEVIETTQKQIDKLQDLKKATMKELLTKGIGHTEFKDSELGRIPKSWEVVALGAIGDFSKGKGISKKETTSEGVPCLRYAEIYTEYDFVIGTFKSFIRSETISTTKKLKTNDIIFAGSGETVEDIGKSVAFVSDCDAYVGGDSIVFSPNIQCNSVFLSYQLNDDLRRIQLRKLGQGSSVIHVYTSGIMQLNVSLPPLLEQNKIAEALLSYTRAIAAKKQKLAQTQSLKKSLMQDLLTGKVRVQVN